MSTNQTQTAQWSIVEPCANKQPKNDKLHWIEIELVYEDDSSPVAGEEYCITLPDNTEVRGWLDEKGWARVDFIKNPGNCKITFPNRDESAWKAV
jgi:hypothetical protein